MLHLVLSCALRFFVFGRGNYISGKRRRGENPRGFRRLAPEMGKEPEEKRKSGTDDETGDDGEIERGVFSAVDDVAREFAEAEGEFGPEVKQSADDDEDDAEQEKSAAEIAERIHGSIVEEEPTTCEQPSKFTCTLFIDRLR